MLIVCLGPFSPIIKHKNCVCSHSGTAGQAAGEKKQRREAKRRGERRRGEEMRARRNGLTGNLEF